MANSINEVIHELDEIIAWSKLHQSRIGYFSVLYRRMTIAVQQGIANGAFEDGKRMEELDVTFANRYFEAWRAFSKKQPCSNAWCKVFAACDTDSQVVLQHLLLGINTHINLDLAIAASATAPGEKIHALKNDFEKINEVIASLTQTTQDSLVKIWFPLKILLMISNKRQDKILDFSISNARKISWANAVTLATLQGVKGHDDYILTIDKAVVVVSERIMKPGFISRLLLKWVLQMESKNISQSIDALNE